MNRVPFRIGTQVMPDLIAGRVSDLCLADASAVLPQHIDKQLKILATTSPQRLKAHGRCPTLKEKGIDFVRFGWLGICAAKGTPQPIIRPAQPAYRVDRGDAGIPRPDREGRLAPGVLDAAGLGQVIAQTVDDVAATIREFGLQQE